MFRLETEKVQINLFLVVKMLNSIISYIFFETSTAQLIAPCFNLELRKYQEVESSHLVTDYKHNLSLLN